jgi:hypothetical protein
MNIDLEHLFRCRVIVARIGEMDMAKWWNTKGVLGPLGRPAFVRNFGHTHLFAQARVVFTVAAARCQEVFPMPQDSYSLWSLPPDIEYALSLKWPEWLRSVSQWTAFFENVAKIETRDPADALVQFELASETEASDLRRLHRSNESRAVNVPSSGEFSTRDVTRLALAFAHSEEGRPAIPYLRCATH